MPGVGRQRGWDLRVFGAHVTQAFGHVPYQVGSSLSPERTWRDVDVRLILPDDEYATLFGNPVAIGWAGGPVVNMWDLAWSALGREMTGLPIDFQFQQQTLANRNHDGPRSALVAVSYSD